MGKQNKSYVMCIIFLSRLYKHKINTVTLIEYILILTKYG